MIERLKTWRELPWQVLALAALVPIWSFGLFARKLWMPDEPREYDIARNMLEHHDALVPHLANDPFLEKPPLTYWLESGSMQVFGNSPAAARAPGLLLAAVTVLALGMLARQWSGNPNRSALIAALVVGTTMIVGQIQIWLATDAAVLACTAVALLSLWNLTYAQGSGGRLSWHLAFWIALTVAFMAKSAFGMMVPVLTFFTWMTWEKRWSAVLRHWQLYVGAAICLVIIASWFIALGHRLGVAEMVATVRDNTIGRYFGTAEHGAYELGHRTARFKFWGAIPYYLLPWTFALIAAGRWALLCLRSGQCASRSQLRFSLCASIPALLLLGMSATARDVYFGPAVIGLALLIAFWISERSLPSDRFERQVLKLTSALMYTMAIAMLAVTALLWDPSFAVPSFGKGVLQALAVILVLCVGMLLHRETRLAPVASALTSFVLALLLLEFFAFPTIDQLEDVAQVMKHNPQALQGRLALLCTDETTRAVLDFGLKLRPPSVCGVSDARSLLEAHADQTFLVQTENAALPSSTRAKLAKLHIKIRPKLANSEVIAGLQKLSVHVQAIWCTAGGRRYALYGKRSVAFVVSGDCS